jgi:hypothetical protein
MEGEENKGQGGQACVLEVQSSRLQRVCRKGWWAVPVEGGRGGWRFGRICCLVWEIERGRGDC